VSGIATYAVELAVGAVCAVAGIEAWRRDHRLTAVILILAGSAAVIHAIVALVGGSS
jgi:peptidoglycan/LPS O-acetylase OafA/YrhL